MRYIALLGILAFLSISCSNTTGENGRREFKDLPFEKATSAKEYSDMILLSIRTSRERPIAQEFSDNSKISKAKLRRMVSMYSTGISGRDDWEEIDVVESSKGGKDDISGFDYLWLEPNGRLGIQIFIDVEQNDKGRFELNKLEFRSRIEVMESYGFPHGQIDNYKPISL